MIEAKFAVLRATNATEEQKRRWQGAVRLSRAFNAADKYVFSLPMWNFGIPYILKHYIDIVTLPGENWLWTPGKAIAACCRASAPRSFIRVPATIRWGCRRTIRISRNRICAPG